MNEKYLLKLLQDMQLKNFTQNTCADYFCFVKKFLDFTNKEALSITYVLSVKLKQAVYKDMKQDDAYCLMVFMHNLLCIKTIMQINCRMA